MKKLLALVLSLLLVGTIAFAQTDKEITFQDNAWGVSYTQINQKYSSYDIHDMSGKLIKTFSVDEVIKDDGGLDFEYTDINVVGNAYTPESQVAGYTTTDVSFYFAYKPVNGILTKELSDTMMYAARYEFATSDLEVMEADLTTKLTGLYGEPDATDSGSNMWGTEFKYVYWYGANDTGVTLIVHHPSVNTFLSEDSIRLVYFTRQGDKWLQEASDAEAYKESLGKNATPDAGDSSGL